MKIIQGVRCCASNCSIPRQSREKLLYHCNINGVISPHQMSDARYSQIPQRNWVIEVKGDTTQSRQYPLPVILKIRNA
ncbi:hypothetical protein [Cupriavidus sp. CP313]